MWSLFDLGFFEDHVLTSHRIVLAQFEFADALSTLLFGGVEVTCAGGRKEANQFTHDRVSPGRGAPRYQRIVRWQRNFLCGAVDSYRLRITTVVDVGNFVLLRFIGFCVLLGLIACESDELDPAKSEGPTRRFVYRGITGVSMGGGASATLGFRRPELFDFVGVMGGPLADATSFGRMLSRGWMGGFCELSELEAMMAEGHDLDDESAFCGLYTDRARQDIQATEMAVPREYLPADQAPLLESVSDYNNWWRGPDGGRGGSFHRDKLFNSFEDISKSFGNALYHFNPDVPWAAPGVTKAWLDQSHEARCAEPVILENYYNAEYNPRGEYPVITVCEGVHRDPERSEAAKLGRILPETPRTKSVAVLLAVDLNRNGRRDYGEPVIMNAYERYRDWGADGISSEEEPGYDPVSNPDPHGDDFNSQTNPSGTEGDWRYQPGEPFDDFGLDGVDGTEDFGEGNNAHDYSQGWQHFMALDAGRLLEALPQDQLSRLDIYMDAGIRDFLNTVIHSNWLWARLMSRVKPDQRTQLLDFDALRFPDDRVFNPNYFDRSKLRQFTYLRYGHVDANENQILSGDGNHVGTVSQVLGRVQMALSVGQAVWPKPDLEPRRNPAGQEGYSGVDSFDSIALGRSRTFSYVLPPEYYDPERSQERYPVLYFLHGQGQEHEDMVASGLIFQTAMAESQRPGVSDWSKFIIIFPDGHCYDEVDDCHSGTFWNDFVTGEQRSRFEADFWELVDVVDNRYRTRAPEEVPSSETDP